MDQGEMRRRFAAASIAHLATVGADGHPHIVPVCFAIDDETLFFAVDSKPKRSTDLKRVRNIGANPAVSLLVDHYEDDWARLWWVRVDGRARVVTDSTEAQKALQLLGARYSQYRANAPGGPVVAVVIAGVAGWSAS